MVSPVRKSSPNNIINLAVVNGKISRKPEVKYNKDGSIDKRQPNKTAGISSEVYPFTTEEIKMMVNVFDSRIHKASDDDKRQIAIRNKMIFLIGINLSLRASDLITLKWNFFFNDNGNFKNHYSLQPKKTKKSGKFVKLYFNETVRKTITDYITEYPVKDMDDYLFKSRKGNKPITEISLGRIIKDAANEAGIEKNICSHSLRKTFGYHIWHNAEDKEKALVMLMVIYNHSSIATTKKYIGIMGEEVEGIFNELNLGLDLI